MPYQDSYRCLTHLRRIYNVLFRFHNNNQFLKEMKYLISLLFIVSSILPLYGQHIIKGTINNAKGENIAYAHVFLKNHQRIGTVSDELGFFSLEIDSSQHIDTLVCSILGYEILLTPISSLNEQAVLIMELFPFEMGEVTITSDNYLKSLLKEAVRNIPNNYSKTEHQLLAYFQDYTISDNQHSELIETDISIKNKGYDKDVLKREIYINQMRKTDDNRNLRDDLKRGFGTSNIIYDEDPLMKRSFSYFKQFTKNSKKTLVDMENEVDKSNLELYYQSIMGHDTIITIQVSDPFRGIYRVDSISGEKIKQFPIFALVTINKTDMAITEIQHGTEWDEKNNWNIYKYRKVNGTYYPVFSKNIMTLNFNNKTAKHHNVQTLYIYDILVNEKDFMETKRKNKVKEGKDLRLLKYKYNSDFWSDYPHPRDLPTTAEVMSAINSCKDINEQFKNNQKKTLKLFQARY